jgi:hypothetical protein
LFGFDHQRSLKREAIALPRILGSVAGAGDVMFVVPTNLSKTHSSTGLGTRACQAGHRVAFATESAPVSPKRTRPTA